MLRLSPEHQDLLLAWFADEMVREWIKEIEAERAALEKKADALDSDDERPNLKQPTAAAPPTRAVRPAVRNRRSPKR